MLLFCCLLVILSLIETAEASSDVPSGAAMVPIATTDANTEPTRKRFKASKEEEAILRTDQLANQAMARAYERSIQFNTTLKAIITWHEKHK